MVAKAICATRNAGFYSPKDSLLFLSIKYLPQSQHDCLLKVILVYR